MPLAQAAERAGFHGVTLSDHLPHPKELASPYPYSADGSPPVAPEVPI